MTGLPPISAARAKSALWAIPADLPRYEWVRVGMAAQSAGIEFEDFDAWSQQADNYDARAARDTWRSLQPDGGIGPGTLFYLAGLHGHQPDKPSKAPVRPAAAQPRPRPGMVPAEVWGRCEPATDAHAYIQKKQAAGVPLEDLRIVPDGDPLRIGGRPMAGALVVPAYGPDGELKSLQLIPADGPKMNLPGVKMAGARHIVGQRQHRQPLYLCEGIGAAWACWQATGRAAVVCFGWGNVGRVAADLRQKDQTTTLVLVPDTGKEADAEKIALEHGCLVAAMPDGWPPNSDVGDFSESEGSDALAELLDGAQAPEPADASAAHPLAQFLPVDCAPKPPRWLLPGFIAEGVTVIAGGPGIGKTTTLLPLALGVAGIHDADWPLAPKHWRHVVYVTEDPAQAQRIIAGLVPWLRADKRMVTDRVHLVEARRLPPAEVARVGPLYRAQFTRTVNGVELPPLVVFDTQSAVLDLENENDNAQVSRAVAALKQQFDGLPAWLVAHVAKTDLGRTEVHNLTARGASSLVGDTHQELHLIREGHELDGPRWLVRGKTRFEARWAELQIHSYTDTIATTDEWGDPEQLVLRWAIARPPEGTRKELAEQRREVEQQTAETEVRRSILDAVETAWNEGFPLNRAGVKSKIRRKTATVVAGIENLISESWLLEIPVPASERVAPSRANFLVRLSDTERETMRKGGLPPAEKTTIPASWKKPNPPVPGRDQQNDKTAPSSLQ